LALAHSLTHSLKRGAALIEFALILPVLMVFFLLLLQTVEIIQTNWVVDFAAENACRAEIVRVDSHPDPEVAAQLSMIPRSSTTFIRGVKALHSDNSLLDYGAHYLGAIAKTRVEIETLPGGHFVYAKVNHAMELKIPVANRILGASTDLYINLRDYLEGQVFKDKEMDMAQFWSTVTGRPHLLLQREVLIRY
jgi:hypothetical protein